MLRVSAPAKINLAFEVLGRRADGYHEVRTVLQAIDLADELTLSPIGGETTLTVEPDGAAPVEGNLVLAAARMLDAGRARRSPHRADEAHPRGGGARRRQQRRRGDARRTAPPARARRRRRRVPRDGGRARQRRAVSSCAEARRWGRGAASCCRRCRLPSTSTPSWRGRTRRNSPTRRRACTGSCAPSTTPTAPRRRRSRAACGRESRSTARCTTHSTQWRARHTPGTARCASVSSRRGARQPTLCGAGPAMFALAADEAQGGGDGRRAAGGGL